MKSRRRRSGRSYGGSYARDDDDRDYCTLDYDFDDSDDDLRLPASAVRWR